MCLEHKRTDTVNGLLIFQFFSRICDKDSDAAAERGKIGIMEDRMGL
jgi:hypothetical protein